MVRAFLPPWCPINNLTIDCFATCVCFRIQKALLAFTASISEINVLARKIPKI